MTKRKIMDNTKLISFIAELIEMHMEKCDTNGVAHWCGNKQQVQITRIANGKEILTITFSDGFTSLISFM